MNPCTSDPPTCTGWPTEARRSCVPLPLDDVFILTSISMEQRRNRPHERSHVEADIVLAGGSPQQQLTIHVRAIVPADITDLLRPMRRFRVRITEEPRRNG